MKKIINILIILIIPISGFATGQVGDKLIWNGDSLTVFSNPLELLYDIDSLRPKLFGEKEAGVNTACWRGYIAEWTMIENDIYLTNIFSSNYYDDSIKSDLKAVFGAECENGKVKATWITGKILIPKSKLIHYVHIGYESFYETEQVLTFENGILTGKEEYNNSKSYESIFTEKQDSLHKFLYTNIEWGRIQNLKDEKVRVFISIQSGRTRKPDSVSIIRGSENEMLNKEALRVVNLIPEWDVYYRLGKVYRKKWTIPIVFNEQKRMKYAH
ncbi:MAG: hypothetical protein ACI85I_001507 [Arenicella sp.]|jgi:hypothetical protein